MLSAPVRVCFVCSGNICRSPTAEVVFRSQAAAAGLGDLVTVSSSGTGGWHAGDDMDARSRAALVAAGHAPGPHAARQFEVADFDDVDVLVALDAGHAAELYLRADEAAEPDTARASLVLLRRFDPLLRPGEDPEVGDPYYGGDAGFAEVLDQITRSCAALLAAIERAVRDGIPLAVPSPPPPPR